MYYNSENQLTDVDVTYQGQSQEIQGFTYGYDANGNRKSFTQIAPAINASYTYTGGNVLQSDTINGTTTNFTFDGNGNQTGSTGGPAFTYNAKEQTTAIGSNTYKYSGPDQQDRVQINSLTLDYSGLGLSRQKDSSGTMHFTRCSCGLLNNERLPGDHTYYYLLDGLGSIVGVTDSSVNGVPTC